VEELPNVPTRYFGKPEVLDRIRAICLAFPQAAEGGGVGSPTFRVRDKIFTMQHPMDGRPSLWCKALPGVQAALVFAEPERYFVPPYVGHHGWVGAWLDVEIDWDRVADLAEEGYRMTAPKRLAALIAVANKENQ
jgi:hypothetical protein